MKFYCSLIIDGAYPVGIDVDTWEITYENYDYLCQLMESWAKRRAHETELEI